jgi:hypothetical protein
MTRTKFKQMRQFDSKWTDVQMALDSAIKSAKLGASGALLAASFRGKAAEAAEKYCHNRRGARAFGNTVAWMLRDIEVRGRSAKLAAEKLEVIQVFINRELALAVRTSEKRNGVGVRARGMKNSTYVENAIKLFDGITKFIEATS